MKHTPAPWKMQFGDRQIIITDSINSYDIAIVRDISDRYENSYNARLISSAPDLLAALESLLTVTELNLDELESDTTLKIHSAVKAIAKVRGESCPQ